MDAYFSTTLPALLLCALLGAAVWHDVRSRRIPNAVVFAGAAAAIALHAALTPGSGLFTEPFGGLGVLASLAGLGLGLLLLLPMYMMRAMGAGDVKLMAMIGAFVGPQAILGVVLSTLLAGGLLALAVALANGKLISMVRNSYQLLLHGVLSSMAGEAARIPAPAAPSGKLPYAIAIAAGTLPYLAFAGVYGKSLFS